MLHTSTLTAQQIFDLARAHLLKQNARSVEADTGYCMYRGARGRMCAVGPFLTDEEADAMELLDVTTAKERNRLPVRLIPHAGLLVDLQNVHDSSLPSQWPHELHWVASRHMLKA